jgi:hypothetical protein
MNQGFALAGFADWVLFWGSDDWAASQAVLDRISVALEQFASEGQLPDLLVCRGRYVDVARGCFARSAAFQPAGLINSAVFLRALFLGATPPHQATLFGPGARQRLSHYAPGFRLSADLDYFLQLSRSVDLVVQCVDLELVHMDAAGISGQQTQRRLQEVRCAYRRAFGWRWWLPFVLRYVRRAYSLLECYR